MLAGGVSLSSLYNIKIQKLAAAQQNSGNEHDCAMAASTKISGLSAAHPAKILDSSLVCVGMGHRPALRQRPSHGV